MKKIDLRLKKVDVIPLLIVLTMASPLIIGAIASKKYNPRLEQTKSKSSSCLPVKTGKNQENLNNLETEIKNKMSELQSMEKELKNLDYGQVAYAHLEEKYKTLLENLEELKSLDK